MPESRPDPALLPSAAMDDEPETITLGEGTKTNMKPVSQSNAADPGMKGKEVSGAGLQTPRDEGDDIPELGSTEVDSALDQQIPAPGVKPGGWMSGAPGPGSRLGTQNQFSKDVAHLKHAIEQIMMAKIEQRRKAELNFSWDMKVLVIYTIFLVLLTVSVMEGTGPVYQTIRATIYNQLNADNGNGSPQLADTNSVADIYQ